MNKDKKKKKSKIHKEKKNIEEEEQQHNHQHYPHYPLDETGKPRMPTIEEMGNPMIYPGYPDLDLNFGNPTGDPNIQYSKNNIHNSLIEDFSNKANYNTLQYNGTVAKLEDLKSSLVTKNIIQ